MRGREKARREKEGLFLWVDLNTFALGTYEPAAN